MTDSLVKKSISENVECHWLCQCREHAGKFNTGKASATLSQQPAEAMSKISFVRAGCACLLLLALSLGCGKSQTDRNAIHGDVNLDGKPLAHGTIMFVPAKGAKGNVASAEINDGRYSLTAATGPMVGFYQVEIHAAKKSGRKIPKPFSPTGEMIEEQIEAIPPQFNAATTLTVEIKPGDNTAHFQVTSR